MKQHRDNQAGLLFSLAPHFRIARLGISEALDWTDELGTLEELISANEKMYPGIRRWFKGKVVPGLKSGQRIAWVGYEGERAIASAVLKLGRKSKFCHLRIDQDYQDIALGQMFFCQMAAEARHDAKEVHFTLPESLWNDRRDFFESFGFVDAARSRRQYRHGEVELSCCAPLVTVWSSVLKKLPTLAGKFSIGGYSLKHKILVSIKPKYAFKILAGSKLVEVRKKFSAKRVGCKAVLYASSPLKALVGEATVNSVTAGSPADIWSQFGASIDCALDEFTAYAGSARQLFAIELGDVMPYREPLGLAQLMHLVREDLTPPQSFCDLRLDDQNSPWVRAVSVASLLHGRFGFSEKGLP